MSRASHSGSFSASLAAMSALGMRTTLAVTSCICSSTGSGIARPSSTRPLHLPRHKVCTQTYFTPFRILAEPLFLFPHTAMTPFQQTIRYCWRTLPAVIWTALVAQEGASNANGEGPCRGSRPSCKLGHLADSLGVRQQYPPVFLIPPPDSPRVDQERIYEDRTSGRRDHRSGLEACLKALRPGNTFVGRNSTAWDAI